jgi:hypothetical protein
VTDPVTVPGAARARRVVALAGVVVLLGLAFDTLVPRAPAAAPEPVPQAPAPAGVWYCPATTAPDVTAFLSVAAVGDTASQVSVIRYTDSGPVADPLVGISPGDELTVALPAEQAARPVAVSWQGGPAVATWRATDAAAPCEAGPADRWYVGGFDTTLGASSTLHLFNPHAVDAVAAVVFATPEGRVPLVRTSNVLVGAGRTVALNLNEFQPEVADLGAVVEVLAGRLVVQGEVAFDGERTGPLGRTLLPAATVPALEWSFAYARADERSSSWLTVLNPDLQRAAAIEVRVSDPNPDGATLLQEVSVPAGGIARIDLTDASTTPEFAVALSVLNDLPVVVHRLTALRTESGRAGVAGSLGASGPATRWALVGGGGQERAGRVSLYNPGAAALTVDVTTAAGEVPGEWRGITLAPNARAMVELTDAAPDAESIPVVVTASAPVVAELRSQSFERGLALWTLVGVPERVWSGPATRPPVRRDPSLPGLPFVAETP